MKQLTQYYLVYIIVLKWLDLKTFVTCLKLRAKFLFKVFLTFFVTFSQKVVQTWFVWHDTWFTTLFGISYCVEMVRIENNSYMLELTC